PARSPLFPYTTLFRSGGARQQVIREGHGERLALRIVRNLLVQRGADALHDPAADLALDDHRVDHRAAILGDGEIEQLGKAGLGRSEEHTSELQSQSNL